MPLAPTLYRLSPIFLQNIFVSAYGFHLRRVRFGGEYRDFLSFLESAAGWSAEKIRQYQAAQLTALYRAASKDVPYYRQNYKNAFQETVDLDPILALQRLPILSKEDVRSASKEFISQVVPQREVITVFTSGTTGSPLQVVATKSAVAANFAFFSRFLSEVGAKFGEPSATFAGRLVVPVQQRKAPYWRYNASTRTWLFSSYHIAPHTAPEYLDKLQAIQPNHIDSYPSSVSSLAHYLLNEPGRWSIRPRVIVTSSETLLDVQRSAIERAFGCPVRDQYGSAEMAGFIAQCAHGSYHANPLYGVVEIVDERGRPCAPGEIGSLVLTGLLNAAMPLIRYRIGDLAAFSPGRCACGSSFPVIQGIFGREDDCIVTPTGERIGRLDPMFKGLVGIKEAQVIQHEIDHLEILVVPDGRFVGAHRDRLIRNVEERVGPHMRIDVTEVVAIPRTSSGKLKSVLSKLRST